MQIPPPMPPSGGLFFYLTSNFYYGWPMPRVCDLPTKIVATAFGLVWTIVATTPGLCATSGAYTLWNKGGVRSNALSGATVAQDVNGAAVVENAAAMSFQNSPVSGTFSYAQPSDTLHRVQNTSSQSEDYFVAGGSLLLYQRLSLGVGLQALRFFAENTPTTNTKLSYKNSIADAHFATALRLGPVGVSASYLIDSSRHTVITEESGAIVTTSSLLGGRSLKFGLLMEMGDWVNIGATYKKAAVLKSQDPLAPDILFSNAYQPEIAQIGVLLSTHPRRIKKFGFLTSGAQIFAQIDIVRFPMLPEDGRMYFGPAVAFRSQGASELNTSQKLIPRLATEVVLARTRGLMLIGRGGCYLEPAFVNGDSPRLHMTAGALLRVWAITAQLAYDVGHKYYSRNIGLGLEFDM